MSSNKYLILTSYKVNLYVKVPWSRKASIYVRKWAIIIFLLDYYSNWRILIGILWEKSLVPLTDGQISMSITLYFELKGWIKSSFVSGFNSWWTPSIIGVGNDNMRDELFGLIWTQFKDTLFTKIKFSSLLKCSPTVS